MYCSNCGAQIDDQSRFCDLCGTPVGDQTSAPVDSASQSEVQLEAGQEKQRYSGFCIAGFIMPFLFFGAIGLPLSIIGVFDCKKNNKLGKGFGIAGIVLSILNIVEVIVTAILLYFFALGMRPH